LALRNPCFHDKANNMLTLTAIVLALGLGWAVIRIWNAMSAEPAPKAPETEIAKQL
jgi:hypothetical protein